MNILYLLLIFIPVSMIGHFVGFSSTLMFIFSALAIVGLAAVMGRATENAAYYLGERVGGFLNATFGNAAELLINIFVLRAGMVEVVKASIVGSIIGNILLVLGLSIFCGGLKHKEQTFNKKSVELNSCMMFFAIIAMCIPAIFHRTMNTSDGSAEVLSIAIAIAMIILYILQIVFTFVTHKEMFGSSEMSEEAEKPKWSLPVSLIVLVVVTIFLGIISEMFTGSVEGMSESFGLSQSFVGLIMIPIIGNAAEHSTAVVMAVKGKMDAALEVSVGSTLQVILFVMPLLVFISLLFAPMNLIFSVFEMAILVGSALIVNRIIADGKSNWFEGVQLLFIYILIAVAYFIV